MTTNPDDLSAACERLHAAIMNLPIEPIRHGSTQAAYKFGHRDARHAAAELVQTMLPELMQQQQPRRVDDCEVESGDDQCAVTEEWLRSVGFAVRDTKHSSFCSINSPHDPSLSLSVCRTDAHAPGVTCGELGMEVDGGEVFGPWKGKVASRGDVRRLAACLGIVLKEPTNDR